MRLPTTIETAIVGAGQAGLTMSWHLREAGREHVLLDRRATLGGGWQDRWESFRLVSPNWTASFPGAAYDGDDPDGFMRRDEIAGRVAAYATHIDAPVILEAAVDRVVPRATRGFDLETSQGAVAADQVIVATGGFHRPNLPAMAAALPSRVLSLHSHDYRREAELPPGGVLVVGSGQSGVQIAEELLDAGREVHLAVGSAGRIPRRYRDRDIFVWLRGLAVRGEALGCPLPTPEQLPSPAARYAGNPQLSGHKGGHDVNLRQLARDGLRLLGRIEGIDGERVALSGDLVARLDAADRWFAERFRDDIDRLIERSGLELPVDMPVAVDYEPPIVTELDLAAAGISTVLWTSGYRQDYRWIDAPVTDELGFPRQRRGVSDIPGLFFIGGLWQHTQASATLVGVDLDAAVLAERMGLPAQGPAEDPALYSRLAPT